MGCSCCCSTMRGKLKPQPTRQPKSRYSGLAVRHLVRKLIRVGLAVDCSHGIDRLRRKRRSAVCSRQRGNHSNNHNKRSTHGCSPQNDKVVGPQRANHAPCPVRSSTNHYVPLPAPNDRRGSAFVVLPSVTGRPETQSKTLVPAPAFSATRAGLSRHVEGVPPPCPPKEHIGIILKRPSGSSEMVLSDFAHTSVALLVRDTLDRHLGGRSPWKVLSRTATRRAFLLRSYGP